MSSKLSIELLDCDCDVISSRGGPLVLLGNNHAERWTSARWYEAACSCEEWIEKIELDGFSALVLGGEPALTWWHPSKCDANGVVGVLFRCIFAPEGYQPPTLIELDASQTVAPDVEYVGGPAGYLFDAAIDGGTALDLDEGVSMEFRSNRLLVKTFDYRPSEEVHLVAHVFLDLEKARVGETGIRAQLEI